MRRKASAAFAPDGTLWLTWAAGGRVSVARSSDLGEIVRPGGDAAEDRAAARRRSRRKTEDRGRPRRKAHRHLRHPRRQIQRPRLHRPIGGWRKVLLGADADHHELSEPALRDGGHRRGRPRLPGLDRQARCSRREGRKQAIRGCGARLCLGGWTPAGRCPTPEIARDNTCECCRIAVSFAGPGKPVVLFRNIFDGGVRDHAVITFSDPSTPEALHRVSDDDAVLDACPHQGPSLSIGPRRHLPCNLARPRQEAERALLRALDRWRRDVLGADAARRRRAPKYTSLCLGRADAVTLAYKTFDGERTTVEVMTSRDSGASWSAPRAAAATTDDSDHPQLLSDGNRVYLSWLTRKDGYRLIALEEKP